MKVIYGTIAICIILLNNQISDIKCESFTDNENNNLPKNYTESHAEENDDIFAELDAKLGYNDDSAFLRWFPWKKSHPKFIRNDEEDCVERPHEGSSIDEFPDDLFTQEQRLAGAVALHFVGAIYFFTVSGMVINYYFIPSVQCICNDLKITPDVGAAVFMATATATPEMFTNVISTFIADSDMGLGTIIGSLMWNILGVAAVSSLANRNPIRMDWYPITRDCVVFAVNAAVLTIMAWDEKIYWWEALILLIMAVFYYILMFQSHRISRLMKGKFENDWRWCTPEVLELNEEIKKPSVYSINVENNGIAPRQSVYSINANHDLETLAAKKRQSITVHNHDFEILEAMKRRSTIRRNTIDLEKKFSEVPENNIPVVDPADEKAELERAAYLVLKKKRLGLWGWPKEDGIARTIFWFYSWPIRLALRCTMPNPKINRRWYPFTFIVCVVWIGVITYLLFWMLIIIGHTFQIPESVMGLTVFAIGGCTPELITGVIMARRGLNGTGICNSMGASSLGILMCLGIPWAISCILLNGEGREPVINLTTYGVQLSVGVLILVPFVQFFILSVSKFRLLKLTGVALACAYLSFVVIACLNEVDIILPTPYIFCDEEAH